MTRERAFGWIGSFFLQLLALGALGVSPYMRYDDLPEPANAIPLRDYVPVIEAVEAPVTRRQTPGTTRVMPNAARIFSDLPPIEVPDGIPEETGLFDEGVEGVLEGIDIGIPVSRSAPAIVRKSVPLPPPEPVRVGLGVVAPRKVLHENPLYPPMALAARIQGTVVLEATIDVRGNVVNVRVLRSLPLLDQAAIDAVLQWKYEPTLLNGRPVPILMSVSVRFELER